MSTPLWDDVRRLADEIELKVHLGGMEARDRWKALQPQLTKLQGKLDEKGKVANDAIEREMASVGTALRRLLDDIRGKA